jgi:hypothetical protein
MLKVRARIFYTLRECCALYLLRAERVLCAERGLREIAASECGSQSEEKSVRFLAAETLPRTLHNSLTPNHERKVVL